MECEMCGKKVATRRYLVDGTTMNLGIECSRFGSPLDAPAPAGTQGAVAQGLERRATRMAPKSIFTQDAMVLVEGYGPLIHRAREQKGLTHDQLGNKVSARVPELKQIEAGKLRPSDDVARRLERELGIKILEPVQAAPAAPASKPGAKGAGSLTIGDLLRDALEKRK